MIKKEIVENLHIPVGFHCNNLCVFCMESDRERRYREIKKFIEDRVYVFLENNRHIKKVIFTSGEPTLNPDLVKYVEYAKKIGFEEISIISNGRRYSDKNLCLSLIKSGVNEFIVSIHGHRKEIHDALTRIPGSFEQTDKGISNLSKLKDDFFFRLTISVVINKVNYKFIGSILKHLRRYNANEIVLNVVQPIGGNMEKRFRLLMPRYGDVAKIISETFLKKNQLFCRPKKTEIGKRYVSVTDLPPCFLRKMTHMIGFGEERLIDDGQETKKIHTSIHKKRGRKCRRCKYISSCDGVYKNYIKNFGWNEFKPVIK